MTDQTVNTIKKINRTDFKALCEHFKMQSQRAKSSCNIDLSVTIDEEKRKDIRRLLYSFIEIGSKAHPEKHIEKPVAGERSQRVVEYSPEKDMKSAERKLVPNTKSLYPVIETNPRP